MEQIGLAFSIQTGSRHPDLQPIYDKVENADLARDLESPG